MSKPSLVVSSCAFAPTLDSISEANVEMFGSSCNGFGFHNSDIDICLTFDGNDTGEVRFPN